MAWVGERVAGYKRVRQIEFTDHIPRSPAGERPLDGTVALVSGGSRGVGRLLSARPTRVSSTQWPS
jgi:hypothetical protein